MARRELRCHLAPAENVRMALEDGSLLVEFTRDGEGFCGDFDPDDPEDVELLRIHVFTREADEEPWVEIEDGSTCTCIPVDTPDVRTLGLLETAFELFSTLLSEGLLSAGARLAARELSRLDEFSAGGYGTWRGRQVRFMPSDQPIACAGAGIGGR